jgi:hypothetical protein
MRLALIRPHEQASLSVCGTPHAALRELNNAGVPYWSEDGNYTAGAFGLAPLGPKQGGLRQLGDLRHKGRSNVHINVL